MKYSKHELKLSTSAHAIPLYYQIILAYELTLKRPSHELKKLNQTLASSTVDLNPHQIDAALFAFNYPLSRGAILCDEVGLGKTIEAGLIISQLWAEGKRRIIIIVPVSMRKQWQSALPMNYYSLNRIKCCFLITTLYNIYSMVLYNNYNMKGEGKKWKRK